MAETRSKTAIYLIGEPLEGFGGRVLPTSLEVLRVYFHYHTNMSQKDAVKTVVQEICEIWNKARLQEHKFQEQEGRSVRYTGKEDLSNKTLDYFIGSASHFFFEVLQLDSSFLAKNVESWEEINSFQEAKKTVTALKVVNDSAERGIALATTFNSSLTKQEDQKQFLFQVVEGHRKRFPDTKKSTLFAETEKQAD